MKPRLLFFDAIRIFSIVLVIVCHMATVFKLDWFPYEYAFDFLNLNPGPIGVSLFIFISGAMLEYTYSNLKNFDDIAEFYVKRLCRIYPAVWISLLIGLALSPYLIATMSPVSVFVEFTGFNTWSGNWGGQINQVCWFIGLIVSLYFMFPFISASMKKYPVQMLCIIAFVEVFSRIILNLTHPSILGYGPEKWLPICRLLEFSFGIYVIQADIYPKWTYTNEWILFFAEISFYVYLVHYYGAMKILWYNSWVTYIVVVGILAWMIMLADVKIQEKIKPYF